MKFVVFEELCLNMYHHIITEGYTMGNSSLVQQVLSNYMSRYGGTFAKAKNPICFHISTDFGKILQFEIECIVSP